MVYLHIFGFVDIGYGGNPHENHVQKVNLKKVPVFGMQHIM